jgi:hypothetical protein
MQTTMYWVANNVQLVYGCFRGDLIQFENKVKEKHANSSDLSEFLREIKIMQFLLQQ